MPPEVERTFPNFTIQKVYIFNISGSSYSTCKLRLFDKYRHNVKN
uniref:Uncharacterized protein n=1 Tax=Anguilla anguilla TaxID=7936 RepID=A0A0E9RK18_ANGAN